MTTYFGILTKIGEAKEANAKALGVPVNIAEMEVGDGGGVLPVPNREQTSLVGSKHRAPINRIFVDPSNPSWLVVEQVIPEQFGGWWARELGLRDADGDLVAVSNCPPTYKPQMTEGSARTQVVRLVLQVSSTNNFTLKIDPSVVLATRQYVDDGLSGKVDKDAVITVPSGGTGHKYLTPGSYLIGNGAAPVSARTADEVLNDIGAAPRNSPSFTGIPTGPTPGQGNNSDQFATTAFVARFLSAYPQMVSISAIPTSNVGPLMIAEAAEMWLWTQTTHFTGYRSPLCGRPLLGHTPNPFVNEVDAVGGLLSKAAYPALWGYAQDAGLVVSQAVWTANIGAHYFVDVNSTQFRVPDLRDMHFRFTGTSADGGPRILGTKQMDAGQRLIGVLGAPQEIGINGVFAALPGTASQFAGSPTNAQAFSQVQLDSARTARVSSETRGINVAFHPRIHI
jgi:hypothetical protein